jgi:DNA-binding SARP family transcriptional activator
MGTSGWRIELLGGLQARREDGPVACFESRKAAALLARLAFAPDRARSRDALAEQLWPDEDGEAVRDRFRHALSALRRVLEPPGTTPGSVLRADRAEVGLVPGAVTTDLADFEAALRQAQTPPSAPERIVPLLRRALALYGGELLPGFYDEWITPERERLAEVHRDALLQMAEALAQTGDLPGASSTPGAPFRRIPGAKTPMPPSCAISLPRVAWVRRCASSTNWSACSGTN